MFYFNQKTVEKQEDPTTFQSLFYWMFYFNWLLQKMKTGKKNSFNPYFTGCSTSTYLHIPSVKRSSQVSILILLDVLLQLVNINFDFILLFYVSILILLDVLLQPLYPMQ